MTAPHLLEPQELAESGPQGSVRIPLDLIDPSPNNPRRGILPEVDELAENIKQFGLLQPVTVRRLGERYELIGGHRRWAAFLELQEREPDEVQWRTIDAVVRTANDERSYLMLISSQVHTRNWRPREEAEALERLAIAGLQLKEIGARLNRTESWASKRLRIYADSVLSGYVQTGQIPTSVAEELLRVIDLSTRKLLAARAAAEGWSLDQARGQVRALRLDQQLSEIERRTRELHDLLSSIDRTRIPEHAGKRLFDLAQLIRSMGRGPVMPTIEQAQRAARVNPNKVVKQKRTRLRLS